MASRPRRGPLGCLAAALAAAVLVAAAGCGGGDGVESGATVHIYVAAPLCAEVKRELGGRRPGEDVRLRPVCLAEVSEGGRVDLARAGANARRATEDSTAVAFVEANGSAAKFARTIVESAGLAFLETGSGANATEQVEAAIGEAGDAGSLREEVAKALE